MQGKTGLKYREGGCTVGSGRVAGGFLFHFSRLLFDNLRIEF